MAQTQAASVNGFGEIALIVREAMPTSFMDALSLSLVNSASQAWRIATQGESSIHIISEI
jgi:hypothetical protein